MSRDIKFKIWGKEQKKFLEINWEGEDARHTKGKANICYSDRVYVTLSGYVNEDGWPYEVDADILQYTGLKDKNGKEIYEGDILSIKIYSGDKVIVEGKTVVEFKDGCFGVIWGYDKSFLSLKSFFNTKFEVVGNKYENPELLEGEE